MEELQAVDVLVEVLAPGVAVGVLVAAVKSAVPALPSRTLPLISIGIGLLYAIAVAFSSELVIDRSPLAIVLLGITVGAEASGI